MVLSGERTRLVPSPRGMRHAALLPLIPVLMPLSAHGQTRELGAMATGALTSAQPALAGRRLTEGYLTQPVVMGAADIGATGPLTWRAIGTLNLEGYTLRRGELNAGMYGEGYIDRRHPHTMVHEAMLAVATPAERRWRASLAAGKGFVPYGTDDPMMRPFLKYPVNHHHAQVIERVQGVAALRWQGRVRWAAVEQAWFNGDEPISPFAAPQWRRVGDSHATRVTVSPRDGLEWQASHAFVRSPGLIQGGALDHRQLSSAVRYTASRSRGLTYLLAEVARTDERLGGRTAFRFTSALTETQWQAGVWSMALRVERTDRPELERLVNPFRTNQGHVDVLIVGITRWTIGTVQLLGPAWRWGGAARLAPFVEVAQATARARLTPTVFEPALFYGAATQWSTTVGLRLHAGSMRPRMGRYGVLSPSGAHEALPGMAHGPHH